MLEKKRIEIKNCVHFVRCIHSATILVLCLIYIIFKNNSNKSIIITFYIIIPGTMTCKQIRNQMLESKK